MPLKEWCQPLCQCYASPSVIVMGWICPSKILIWSPIPTNSECDLNLGHSLLWSGHDVLSKIYMWIQSPRRWYGMVGHLDHKGGAPLAPPPTVWGHRIPPTLEGCSLLCITTMLLLWSCISQCKTLWENKIFVPNIFFRLRHFVVVDKWTETNSEVIS